jgi:chromosome segregation ATPase
METASTALGFTALAISAVGLVLAAAAYLRASSPHAHSADAHWDRHTVDRIARSLREGLEESLSRVKRAQLRLSELGERASEGVHRSIEELSRQLTQLKREVDQEIAQLRTEISSRAVAAQDAFTRRLRHIEANIEILRARAEISVAEELAEEGMFLEAEELLEDAVARIREVKMRLSDIVGDDPAFAPVIEALNEAIHSIRARAADHKRQLDTVLSASDSLLAWLKSREQAAANVGA